MPHQKPAAISKINENQIDLIRKAPDVAEVQKAGIDLLDEEEEDSEESEES